jgi:hypothetical protein
MSFHLTLRGAFTVESGERVAERCNGGKLRVVTMTRGFLRRSIVGLQVLDTRDSDLLALDSEFDSPRWRLDEAVVDDLVRICDCALEESGRVEIDARWTGQRRTRDEALSLGDLRKLAVVDGFRADTCYLMEPAPA